MRALGYVTMYPGPEVNGRVQFGRGLMHANYFETSVMLHLHPELVRMDRATSHVDVDSFWDYRMDQVSDTGVWGRDVAEANAEHGRSEFERCVETTARAVATAVAEPGRTPPTVPEVWKGPTVKIFDITLPIHPQMLHWGRKPEVEVVESLANGDASNVTRWRLGAHTGTHVDAPAHFVDGATPIDEVSLYSMVGPAWWWT